MPTKQRKYNITVDVEDTEKEEISLTENKLTFKAIGGVDRKTYAVGACWAHNLLKILMIKLA